MLKLSFWRNFEFPLFAATIFTCLFGVAMIHSAINGDPKLKAINLDISQLTQGMGIGLIMFFILARLDYHFFESWQLFIYITCLGLLLLVEILGVTTLGSTRWIPIGPFQFQPSEPAKLLIVMLLARFYVTNEHRVRRLPVFIFSILQILPITVLVFIEPDLGTTLVFLAIWFGMTIAAGADWQHLVALVLIAVPLLIGVWNLGDMTGGKVQVFQQYQKDRLELFLHPDKDPTHDGYNLIQSRKTVEDGGLVGRGYMQGPLVQEGYLKVAHADFIFSTIAEEFGFAGSVLVMAVLALMLMRIINVAIKAADSYGRYLCVGVAVMIFFQIFVNAGMNLGLMPVTGITLPLISHGTSSLWTTFMGLGLVESVALRHQRNQTWYYRTGPTKEH